jgi:hypothetical protein
MFVVAAISTCCIVRNIGMRREKVGFNVVATFVIMGASHLPTCSPSNLTRSSCVDNHMQTFDFTILTSDIKTKYICKGNKTSEPDTNGFTDTPNVVHQRHISLSTSPLFPSILHSPTKSNDIDSPTIPLVPTPPILLLLPSHLQNVPLITPSSLQ